MAQAPRDVDHSQPVVERLDYHRKAAKDLLDALRADEPGARDRLAEALGSVPNEARLADAQRAIAREHGYASWAAFRDAIARQADQPARSVARIGPEDPSRYHAAAQGLARRLADGDQSAIARVRAHVPRLARSSDADLTAYVGIGDTKLVIAREYGFQTWRALTEGLRDELAAWQRARRPDLAVTAALDAIRAGDSDQLAQLLDAEPALVHVEVGAGGSLLGEVAQPDVFGTRLSHALGVDRRCVQLLIGGGSDLDGPLNLAACFDRVELVELLLAAGARVDARGIWGITPLETGIYHAARASVDMLAAVAIVPMAPWTAAGAGRVELLEQFFNERGGLTPAAYEHRPNPADIGWLHRLPALENPQDVLDEALVHAAQNDRPDAVAWLLEHGANPNACPYQGCGALHLAAAFGADAAVRVLIAAGAEIDRRNQFNGDNALGWAEYVLARERPDDPGVTAVRDYLRELGSTPAVWGA